MYNLYKSFILGGKLMSVVAMKASVARGNFSELLDDVEKRPIFINRKRENYIVLPLHLIRYSDPWKIKVTFGYDDTKEGRVYFTKNNIFPDLIGWGNTKAEAIRSFVESIVELSHDFYDKFHIYSLAPNRQQQIMPILKILSIIVSGGNISELIEEGKN